MGGTETITSPDEQACALFECARRRRDEGAPVSALKLSARALVLFGRRSAANRLDIANVLIQRAAWFLELGRAGDAAESAGRAHARLRSSRAQVAILLRCEALLHRGHGRVMSAGYPAARRDFLGALRIAGGLGPRPESRALMGLGVVAKFQRRFEDAEHRYAQAAALLRRPADDALRASLLHNLGGLAHARGRFGDAERHARRGLAIRMKLQGENSIAVALDRAALAAILHRRGRLAQSAVLYRKALRVLKATLGSGHFEVAFHEGQLAKVERDRGFHSLSRDLFGSALPALRGALGAKHPFVTDLERASRPQTVSRPATRRSKTTSSRREREGAEVASLPFDERDPGTAGIRDRRRRVHVERRHPRG